MKHSNNKLMFTGNSVIVKSLNKNRKRVISEVQKLTIIKKNRFVERMNTAFDTNNKNLEETLDDLIMAYLNVPELPEIFDIIDNKFSEYV